ncbi:hypothetical protein IIA79_03540 [bacterium]|nr:hypothetical protein [bacterium]
MKMFSLIVMVAVLTGAVTNEDEAPVIPLDTRLRFIIRPTLLGLVPLTDPEGYGEAFVRVTDVGEDSLTVHYEIKEEVQGAARAESGAGTLLAEPAAGTLSAEPGAGTSNEAGGVRGAGGQPLVKDGPTTRIRRGNITVHGLNDSAQIISPLFWGDGDWETDSGLLWLSRKAMGELHEHGITRWSLESTGDPGEEPAGSAAEGVAGLLAEHGLEAGDELALVMQDGPAAYPCYVNGKRVDLWAIRAADSAGLADYWILDDPGNPLVLKMSYKPAPLADPSGLEAEDMFAAGGGFAITEINF